MWEASSVVDLLMVGGGGFVGANVRYLLGRWIADRFGSSFPYGTLIINVTGSLLIGFVLTVLAARSGLSPNYRLLVAVGFLGAYTTFSTYTYDSLTMMRGDEWFKSVVYLAGSVVLGMAAVTTGMFLGRRV
jgi:CrcB protein